ncbi:MAG: cold shock domain-containing protein [Chlorobiaceae bacterium]
MVKSKVKWFHHRKGFGFILNPDGGEDIFVHYSHIVSEQKFKFLHTDAEVDFELEATTNGLQARKVQERPSLFAASKEMFSARLDLSR